MSSTQQPRVNGHAQEPPPPPHPATNRSSTHTLRVENVPSSTTKEQLVNQLARLFGFADHRADIQIRSLVPALSSTSGSSSEELTATLSFAGASALSQPFEDTDEDISIDTGFLGFTPLNKPAEPVTAELVAIVTAIQRLPLTDNSLIAIPGVSGHPFESWASSSRHMWLRDALPKDLPNVRVLLYGYERRIRSSSTFLSEHARDLKRRLDNLRQPQGSKRPIIFVGHSLGCLLIKKLLVDARNLSRLNQPFDVPCVAFFGAPHFGLGNESLKTLFGTSLTNSIRQELSSNSECLRDLHNDYSRFWGHIDTLTVYETEESRETSQLIVPQEVALLHTTRECAIESPSDHFQMVKLARTQAGIYYAVLDSLVPSQSTDFPELPSTPVSPEILAQNSCLTTTPRQSDACHENLQTDRFSTMTLLPTAALTGARNSTCETRPTEIRSDPLVQCGFSATPAPPAELPPEGTRSAPLVAELPADSPNFPRIKAQSFDGLFQPYQPRRKSTLDGALDVFRRRRSTVSASSVEMTNWFLSARENDQQEMRALLQAGASIINKGNLVDEGRTALHYAADQGHLNLVRWLLEKKAKVDVKDKNEQTPLHVAAAHGSLEILNMLVNANANVDTTCNDGSTPLHFAAFYNRKVCVRALLSARANPEVRRYDGKTPLQLSISRSNTEISKLLQSACSKTNENHWPGLH